jgi:hypothetical protein
MRTGRATVTVGPKGTFVYTGGRPARIEVLEIVPPSQVAGATDVYEEDSGASIPVPPPRRDDAAEEPPPAPSPTFPPAY